jgi:hypothetical protein
MFKILVVTVRARLLALDCSKFEEEPISLQRDT